MSKGSAAVVWLDRENAKLFELSHERMAREDLRAHRPPDHHTHRKDAQEVDEKESEPFYREIADKLRGATGVVILGPGLAKNQLNNFLKIHEPEVATRVVAVESVDHPTDGEIASYAAKYLKPR